MRNLAMNANNSVGGGFSAEERAAIKQSSSELKNETTRGRKNKKAAEELDVLNKIAGMEDHDRELAERLHSIEIGRASCRERVVISGGAAMFKKDGRTSETSVNTVRLETQ